jgi:hypothetical protein
MASKSYTVVSGTSQDVQQGLPIFLAWGTTEDFPVILLFLLPELNLVNLHPGEVPVDLPLQSGSQ